MIRKPGDELTAEQTCYPHEEFTENHRQGSCGVILPLRRRRWHGSLGYDETSAAALSAGEFGARSWQIKAGRGEQRALGAQLRRSISCPRKTY
ncbi:uncharacterized [Tachysurus ichikawai]